MNAKWFLAAILMLVVLGTLAASADAGVFTVTPFAADDLAGGRLMYRMGEDSRTSIGFDGAWIEGALGFEDDEAIRVAFAGTYDVIQTAPLNIAIAEIPSTIYIGVLGGVQFGEDEEDASAALMTGVRFGDGSKGVNLGIEYQYLLDETLWKELGTFDDTGRLLATVDYTFVF